MKHLILLLYLLSYTSGMGATTLFVFYYLKYRQPMVQRLIGLDLFFTLTLVFDTVNYYARIIRPNLPQGLELVLIFGLLAGSAGIVYYLTALTFEATGKVWQTRQKVGFAGIVIAGIALILTLVLLCRQGVVSHHVAFHTGFVIPNFYLVVCYFYTAFMGIRAFRSFEPAVRSMVKAVLILSTLVLPLSLVTNLVQFKWKFPFPLAFSPVQYFILNLIFIFFALKYFMGEEGRPAEAAPAAPGDLPTPNPDHLFQELHISEREAEIIGWVIRGYNNPEIAAQLFISPNTVKNHLYSIFKKLGVKNRFELINLMHSRDNTASSAE
ncbi:MAG TPA: helix-turn-helix transcriptional regulator [Bacillota bacterium]|nr:helix-turn-helix transcriptional regulator [Bacillota bacterium]